MRQGILRRARLLVDRQSSLSISYMVYTLALGFSGAVQLGLLFLFARLLPTSAFGLVTLLMVAIPLAARFVTLGSDIGLAIRIWKRPRIEQQADLNAMLTWTWANSVLIVLLGLVAWQFMVAVIHPLFFVCALLAATSRNLTEILLVMLRREGRVAQVGALIVVRALLFGGMCGAALVILGHTAFAYLLGVLASEGTVALWALARLHRLYGLRLAAPGSGARMRELVRVGFPTLPGAVAALLLAGGDRFIITAVLGLAAAGVYALGQRLAESVVQILFIPFATAFGPFALGVASQSPQRAFDLIGRTALTFAYLGGVVLGVPAIVGRQVVLALIGSEYAPGATIFLLVIAGFLVFQIAQILAVYFNHTEQIRKHMWIILAAAASNIALNFFAVKAIGIIGAAVVSLVIYQGVLIAVAFTARPSGIPLVSLRRLYVPLLLFFAYLLLIYQVDSQGMATVTAVLAKTLVWAVYLTICLALSREARSAVTGMAERLRLFLAA